MQNLINKFERLCDCIFFLKNNFIKIAKHLYIYKNRYSLRLSTINELNKATRKDSQQDKAS